MMDAVVSDCTVRVVVLESRSCRKKERFYELVVGSGRICDGGERWTH